MRRSAIRTLIRRPLWSLFLLQSLLLLATLDTAPQASAQALNAASKSMDISVFGGYLNVNPDYAPKRDSGATLGADITRYFGWRIDPSLEVRYNYATGPYIQEHSYEVGVRVQTDIRRYHPYVNFLAGVGYINFPQGFFGVPTYTHDSTTLYSIGGGVDIDVYRRFQLKIDYQGQTMKFTDNFSLAPRPLVVGVVYRIPFRPYKHN